MGLTKDNFFVFGSIAGHLNINGPSQGPWLLNNTKDSGKGLLTTAECAHSSTIGNSNNGENRELGNFLQGQNNSDWRPNNPVD